MNGQILTGGKIVECTRTSVLTVELEWNLPDDEPTRDRDGVLTYGQFVLGFTLQYREGVWNWVPAWRYIDLPLIDDDAKLYERKQSEGYATDADAINSMVAYVTGGTV